MSELIWEGKYDEKGNLKPADKTILPFQVVEAVNGSKAEGEKAQRDWVTKLAQDTERRNILIWGDDGVVMSSLLRCVHGQIILTPRPAQGILCNRSVAAKAGETAPAVERESPKKRCAKGGVTCRRRH